MNGLNWEGKGTHWYTDMSAPRVVAPGPGKRVNAGSPSPETWLWRLMSCLEWLGQQGQMSFHSSP